MDIRPALATARRYLALFGSFAQSAAMRNKRDLTQGSVHYQLLRLASPLSAGIVAMFAVAIVDTYLLGQLGTDSLAAIGFAFPVSFTVMSLAIGLSAGTASVLARAIGGGDRTRIVSLATHGVLLAVLLGAGFSLCGILAVRPLFSAMGASGEVLEQVTAFMRIWFYSFPLLVLTQVSGSVLRANGDALVPSGMMIAGAAINIALDPFFIFGGFGIPAMGIEGAAWAAFVARCVVPFVLLPVLIFRDRLLSFARTSWAAVGESWREILRIGVAAALGNAASPFGLAVVTAMLAVYGDAVVAAFGVAGRLEAFGTIPMLALSGSIGPICGQNWGAGHFDRVRQALRFACSICLGWSLFMAGVFWFAGDALAGAFTGSEDVTEEAALYLSIVPVTVAGYGITIVAAGAFNALGRPLLGLSIYLVRIAIFYIPLAFVATLLFDSLGVYVAIALANLLAGLCVYRLAFRWLAQMTEEESRA